jgi:hypothetical protein
MIRLTSLSLTVDFIFIIPPGSTPQKKISTYLEEHKAAA